MTRDILEMVGEWARERVDSGEEPPWSYFKLKQLAELTDDLAEGMMAVKVHEAIVPTPPLIDKDAPEKIVSLEKFRLQAAGAGAVEKPSLPV